MVFSNNLHRPRTQGSTQKQAAMKAWMTREQKNICADGSAKPGHQLHWGQRDVQCSRCTQRQTGDIKAGLRFRQIQAGLEAASSWSFSVCPNFCHLSASPHLSLLLIWTFQRDWENKEGTARPRSLLQTLHASGLTVQVWNCSGSYCPVWTLAQTRCCWPGSCVSNWR